MIRFCRMITFSWDGELNECVHQHLNAMKDLNRAGTPVDLVTMYTELQKSNRIEIIGGATYLPKLVSSVVTTANVKSYIRIVRECATRRRLRGIGESLIQASAEFEKNVDEIRETAALDIRKVKGDGGIKLVNQEQAVIDTYEQLSDAQKREDQPDNRIMTGLGPLDKMTGGLYGSKLMIIGARPSVGKSIFAMTICLNAAKQGKRVLLVTLEMDEVDVTKRVIASEGGGTLNEITSGNIQQETWVDMARIVGPISSLPLWYSTTANTVEKVRRCAYALYEKGGLDLIAVDYIQLMEVANNSRMNRQEEISKISRGLRLLSSELKIPILVLTQLNRTSAKGQMIKGKKVRQEPTMSEARESGSIEQDANIFMLLHDPDESEMRNEEEKEVYKALKSQGYQMMRIIIDKNRQGKRGRVTLAFDGDHMRFLPIARNAEAPY